MANKLTGSYNALAQISRRQLNGLLASLQQNGASGQPPLRLGHNGVLRIGDPKPTTPELVRLRLRNWMRNFQSAGGPSNLDDFRARLAVHAPPGAAKMMEEEFSKLEKGRPGRQPSKKPRGRVQLQLSSLEWESGKIKLSAHLKLVVRPGPDVSFKFTQKFKLALNASTQQVTLEADGNPSVNTDLPFNFLHEAFENAVKEKRDDALSGGAVPVNDAVKGIFAGARQKLIGGLKIFDESASATFSTVKITKDGLIVRGEIGSGPRQAPVVQFNEIDEGRAFSALGAWIPGGKIDRYIWSWVGHSGKGPAKLFSVSHKYSIETHRFIFPKPAGMDPLGSVSLRIEGTQTEIGRASCRER